MSHKITRFLLSVVCGLFVTHQAVQAQTAKYDPSLFISVDINSGNPTTPYPQFLEYKEGKSLAKYNSEGVTHADMEKAGREAYQIMSHRCRYFGGTHCGVKYIVFNPIANGGTTETSYTYPEVEGAYGTFCSEGDGYMLLASAIFADQATFNGLYMWIHDNRFSKVKRFQDGEIIRPTADCGPYLAGWGCDETTAYDGKCHSATDGDVDIAMAMLVAYKQWGEWMMQDGKKVLDSEGNPISLKEEAKHVIGALTDTIAFYDQGNGALTGFINGDIGIDGYTKRGNSWGELTRWRFNDGNSVYPGINGPYNVGPNLMSIYGGDYCDYDAPAYYNEFWKWLSSADAGKDEETDWRVSQFKRAEASADWITGQAYSQGYVASIGSVSMSADDGSDVSFGNYVDGEDFRYAWRHLLNYLWHGDPEFTWDPASHQIKTGTNSYNKDMATRHAALMKEPIGADGEVICTKLGASPDAGQPMWYGVSQVPQQWAISGKPYSAYHTNYELGSSAGAAVLSEDQELLGDWYRQCDLTWDGTNTSVGPEDEERYLGSTPKYFHGWFRCLGLLTCSGNLISPETMTPKANVKVYMSVDKTYAYVGDDLDYTVQYRNYGTADASGVTISTVIDDKDYDFVSATKGGKYDAATHTITWNIGTIPGFKSGALDATIDSVSFRVNIKDTLNPRVCLVSTISGDNFEDWVSNEYPNHATYTMERNCVDILANRSLKIKKTANRTALNPGDVVKFTVEFSNISEGEDSWLNGGRDNVRLSYGNNPTSIPTTFYQYYRFWNDASEAYINLGNYRVSYFMYDAAAIGLYDATDNPTGWTFDMDNGNDMKKYGWMPTGSSTTFTYQKIPQGSDEYGKWNQRLMIQFPGSLMAPSTAVYDHLNNAYQLHKGGYGPCFFRTGLKTNPSQDITKRVSDDWSYSPDVSITTIDGQAETYTMISPCWANYDDPGYEITNYSRHTCSPKSIGNFGRVLVEEYDGYTWRRIQGTGPLPGKEAYNVTVIDTIPYELEFYHWVDSTALKDDDGNKIQATYTPSNSKAFSGIVKWTIPVMLVGEKDKLIYTCKARDMGCPDVDDVYYKNVAWISSKTDSPDSSEVDLMTTCAELPPVIEPQTSLTKSADKKKAQTGETVSYTVKFKNTEGTHVDADCSTQTGWIPLGSGSVAPVATDGMKLSTNGSSAYFFGPEKAYGSDGDVMVTIGGSPSSTQELYLVMRYVSGIPGTASFKGVCMKMLVNKDGQHNFGYELYNDGTLIQKEGTSWEDVLSFPGNATAPTFKFVLNGDHLYMYINDADDDWENVVKDWEGLTSVGPGYFGMYVNSNGNSSTVLSKFETNLDYAFDVTLYDQLPAELGNITEISDDGKWDEDKNLITWPTVATTTKTALAPNDSIERTFTAEVLSCNNYINNYGLATVYGLDTLKVLNTIECGEAACELESVTLAASAKKICATDSAVIKATVTPKGTSYFYQYYKDGEPLGKLTQKKDSMVVKETGEYYVKVFTALDTTTEPVCYVKSKTVTLAVDTMPVTALTDTSACSGKTIELKATADEVADYTYEWSDGSTAYNLSADAEGSYTVTVTNGECVAKDTAEITYGAASLSGGIFNLGGVDYDRAVTDTGAICPGIEGTLSVNYVADDGEYKWSSKPADAGLVTDGATATIAPATTTTYYVEFVQGCEAIDSFTVKIGEPMKITVEKTVLCDTVRIDATTADSKKPVFHWSLDGNDLDDNKAYMVFNEDYSKGTVSVYATADDACTSDPETITFQNTSMTVDVDGSPSVCPGKTTTVKVLPTTTGMEDTPTYTYAWLDETKSAIAGETGESITVGAGTYYGVVSNGVCTDTVAHTIMNGAGEHVGNFSVNDSILYGATKTYGACGEDLVLKADYEKTDGDFTWKVDGVEQTETSNTITVTPTKDMLVTVKWVNECDAFDTLHIVMQEDVPFTIDSTKTCGKTTVNMASTVEGVHYYWTTSAATDYEGANYVADLTTYPAANGSSAITVKSKGYCSVDTSVKFTIDTLGVTLTGDPSVCDGTPASLKAVAVSNDPAAVFTYTYGYRKAGSVTKFTEMTADNLDEITSQNLSEATEFQVTVSDGTCTATDVWTVTIGAPARTGALTVTDKTISTNAAGTKFVRSCGDETLNIAVTYESTADDYTWTRTVDGVTEDYNTGKSITVAPDAAAGKHIEQYILTYTNECPVSDTINVEVYPLSVTADWLTGNFTGEHCEGDPASATITVTGYDATMDGSYINWYKDDVKLDKYDGKTEVSFMALTTADAGTYSYKVSNGVCEVPAVTDNSVLTVNPYATVKSDYTQYIVPRGNDTTIALTVTPDAATVSWTESGASFGTGNPLNLTDVEANHNFVASVSAEGYCSDSVKVKILVDAKPVVTLSADLTAICEGETVTLTADTTGTGTLIYPKNYALAFYALDAETGEYNRVSGSGTSIQVLPTADATYKAVVTYGNQSAESEPVNVKVFSKATYTLSFKDSVCAGVEVPIIVSDLTPSDATIDWSGNETLTGSGLTATATPATTTLYNFVISQNNGACTQTESFRVTAAEPVIVEAEEELTICEGDRVQLAATVTSGSPTSYKWTIDGTDSLVTTLNRYYVKPEQTTVYKFEAGDGICESASVTTTVTVAESPEIVSTSLTGIRQTTVNVTGGTAPYQFSTDDKNYQDDETITFSTYGIHTIYVKDDNGCKTSIQDTLEAPEIAIPVVVSPDGDGINDLFEIPGMAEAYPNSKITIYDRFGKKVAEYKAADGGWDGTYNGKKCASTDYWYEIYVYEIRRTYTGHFTLVNP